MNKPDVWDAVNEINNRTMDILERLARIEARLSNGIPTQLKDHEKRIRKMEKGFWIAVGALALGQLVLGILPMVLKMVR